MSSLRDDMSHLLNSHNVCDCEECVESQLPDVCSSCAGPLWDGLHRNGHRECFMSEVPGV